MSTCQSRPLFGGNFTSPRAATRLFLGAIAHVLLVAGCTRTPPVSGGEAPVADGTDDAKPPVTRLVSGWLHTCYLRHDGQLSCWGAANFGQLGPGETSHSDLPAPIPGLPPKLVSVSSGQAHLCARDARGHDWCWGGDAFGQQGDGGTNQDRVAPHRMTGFPDDSTRPRASGVTTCARQSSGGVHCFGADARTSMAPHPVEEPGAWPILDDRGIATIASELFHGCALTNSGAVWCWGRTEGGKLGDAKPVDPRERVRDPVRVSLSEPATRIELNNFQTCAIGKSGKIWCWGRAGSMDQSPREGWATPKQPDFGDDRARGVDISMGPFHGCAVLESGAVYCWGQNDEGQLGDGSRGEPTATPVRVTGLPRTVVEVSVGSQHSCAATGDGEVYCWGSNHRGQLGRGSSEARDPSPAPVALGSPGP